MSVRNEQVLDELHDSDYLASGEAHVNNYLFNTESGLISFVIVEEEMAQINDFFLACGSAVANKLTDLSKQIDDTSKRQPRSVAQELDDVTDDINWYISGFLLPRWDDTAGFLIRAMCLLLLSAFTEKSLRALCEDLRLDEDRRPKPVSGGSKIAAYIAFLRVSCGMSFTEPEEYEATRESCRRLRNAFAHGEWDEVRKTVENVSLRRAFEAITELFKRIEYAMMERDEQMGRSE